MRRALPSTATAQLTNPSLIILAEFSLESSLGPVPFPSEKKIVYFILHAPPKSCDIAIFARSNI